MESHNINWLNSRLLYGENGEWVSVNGHIIFANEPFDIYEWISNALIFEAKSDDIHLERREVIEYLQILTNVVRNYYE